MDENQVPNQETNQELTPKQKQQQAGKDVAEVAAKAAGSYFGGAAGAQAVDAISKTKVGQHALNQLGNKVSKSPGGKRFLKDERLQNAIHKAKPMANQAIGAMSGNPTSASDAVNQASNVNEAANQTTSTSSSSSQIGSALKMDSKSPFKFLNNSSSKEESKPEELSASGEVMKMMKKIFVPAMGAFGGFGGCMGVIIIVIIAVVMLSPLFYIGDLINNTKNFGEKLVNFLTFRGWCTDQECTENEKNNFYTYVDEVYDYYNDKYNVKLNTQLIVATLTYNNPFVTESIEEDITFDYDEELDLETIDYKRSKNNVKKLAQNMVNRIKTEITTCYLPSTGAEVDCNIQTNEQLQIVTEVITTYELDEDKYKKYLQDTFIEKFYFKDYKGDDIDKKIEQVIDEIYSRVDFYAYLMGEKKGYKKIYATCPGGVTVNFVDEINGEKQIVETKSYPLEEYISGVVCAEGYCSANMEALKAQAIAARTYALVRTDNCTVPIESSSSDQNFQENFLEQGIQAAKETEGLVLIHNGSIFLSEYDSYCYDDESCEYGEENGRHYVVYEKLPAGETHKVYLSEKYYGMIGGGHGRGLSQVASYEMADNGSTYDEILKYFYSDGVEIVSMISVIGDFTSSSIMIQDKEELGVRSDTYAEMGVLLLSGENINVSQIYSKTAGNLGQCPWYAKSRALELILYSDRDEKEKLLAFKAIEAANGHGRSWYDDITSLDNFEKSNNVEEPRVGAIVSWSSNASLAGHSYGHVAIIESVNYEKREVVISESWNGAGADAENTWENAVYKTRTLTFDQLKNYAGYGNGGYTFNGYVYIL